jgi:hypothetical protein
MVGPPEVVPMPGLISDMGPTVPLDLFKSHLHVSDHNPKSYVHPLVLVLRPVWAPRPIDCDVMVTSMKYNVWNKAWTTRLLFSTSPIMRLVQLPPYWTLMHA